MTEHTPAPPFAHSSGPRNARIALVGEAWGEQESITGLPFMGNSGQELSRLLTEAGIPRAECFLTNVLALRPVDNKLDSLCASKAEVGHAYNRAPLRQGIYLRPEYLPELDRLARELQGLLPSLVIALGGTALWALCNTGAIGSLRGTVLPCKLVPGLKVLPTYHPSYLFKVWSHRPVVLADLMKARHEGTFPEIRRPARRVLVNPTIGEIGDWVTDIWLHPPKYLSVDIETATGSITMIGFARSRANAIVIPFFDRARGGNFWQSEDGELAARAYCQDLLGSSIPKLTQNGLYDIQYLLREGYSLRAFTDDTMLLHHSLYPEMKKGLGFLGSIYTSEPAWKLMRRDQRAATSNTEELKRDE